MQTGICEHYISVTKQDNANKYHYSVMFYDTKMQQVGLHNITQYVYHSINKLQLYLQLPTTRHLIKALFKMSLFMNTFRFQNHRRFDSVYRSTVTDINNFHTLVVQYTSLFIDSLHSLSCSIHHADDFEKMAFEVLTSLYQNVCLLVLSLAGSFVN